MKRASHTRTRTHARTHGVVQVKLILYLKARTLIPAVCFAFSKKRCEDCAAALGNVDLNDSKEKSAVTIFMNESLRALKPEDRGLPQIRRLYSLAQRGVGVHHAGVCYVGAEVRTGQAQLQQRAPTAPGRPQRCPPPPSHTPTHPPPPAAAGRRARRQSAAPLSGGSGVPL